ncbi:MAG: type II toxin-antitoxin system VapC family toxin [Erythrobacter sp.]
MGSPDKTPARVVIDCDTAIRIASEDIVPDPAIELLAPTLLRSHVLDTLFKRVRKGHLDEERGLTINASFSKLKIRFLGDAVMRRRAWAIADRQGLGTTEMAEYVALTLLQADALVTSDERLLAAAGGLVPLLDPLRLGKSR